MSAQTPPARARWACGWPETFDGEIISADSRQVFRGLDLGSGKITPEEMQGVPHYLIDVREPGEFFSMADFQRTEL